MLLRPQDTRGRHRERNMPNPAQDPILTLQLSLAHYKEEVNRLRAHERDLKAELDEAHPIMLDLVATIERLAAQLDDRIQQEDKYGNWWYPSVATARVWLGKNNKNP